MANYLIIGGAGFIGCKLAKYLSGYSYNNIDIADNFLRGSLDSDLKSLLKLNNVKLLNLNLIDNLKKQLKNNYDYIFNLAAIIGVANVLKSPQKVLIDNFIIQKNSLEICQKQKKLKKFIFFSTSEVYAGSNEKFNTKIPSPEDTPLTVSDLKSSRSTYMLSKIYGEAMCYNSNIPFLILRPHNIYGERMGMNHVIPEVLKKISNLKKNQKLKVYTPDHTRSFCYVDDAIKQIINLTNSKIKNDVFNIGNDSDEISIKKLVIKCQRLLNNNNKIVGLPDLHKSPKRRCPEMKKTFKIIGKNNFTTLEDGITKVLSWYKMNNII